MKSGRYEILEKIKIKRFAAAYIDFIAICILSQVIALIALGIASLFFPKDPRVDLLIIAICGFMIILYAIVKDLIFKNASIGKKVLQIKVVTLDGKKLGFFKALKRALPLVIFPLEILFMVTDNTRIGDSWAKTTVVDDALN